MSFSIKKLAWDTDFFEFNVGQIEGNLNDKQELQHLEQEFRKTKTILAYYSCPSVLPNIYNSDELYFTLVDKKITYVKTIDQKSEINENVFTVDENVDKKQLNKLAIQSGVHSRFNVDFNIPQNKFEELYSLWMTNSLNKRIAKEVLIYKSSNELAGFVTLGEKYERADIGIIAVDKNFRGQGIGKTLMTCAEKWFATAGYEIIQVVTQGENVPACRLYEKCGYSIDKTEFIYHVWSKHYLKKILKI